MRTIILSSLLFLTTGLLAQNVGIGTLPPLDLLNVIRMQGIHFYAYQMVIPMRNQVSGFIRRVV